MNTAVAYVHRAPDHTTHARVVFTGETTEVERSSIEELFPLGAPLLPNAAGLPVLSDGHGRHELTEVSHVDEIPTHDANIHDFVARLLSSHWEHANTLAASKN